MKRNIYKDAIKEIQKYADGDTSAFEFPSHVANILMDVKAFESGNPDKMVYL